VEKFRIALRQLRPLAQPAICVGLAMIVAIWVSINFHLSVEHDRSRSAAVQATGNLARAFEEHIVRTIMEADRAILLLRTSYQLTGNFDLANSLAHPSLRNDLLTQIRVFDQDGVIIAATAERSLSRAGYGDREYFRSTRPQRRTSSSSAGRSSGGRVGNGCSN
jgi:hypothetical protein